jgi:hypothetical protein
LTLPSATSSPLVHYLPVLTYLLGGSGLRAYRVGMTMKLMEKMQELNAALLKILEKDNMIMRLSEQLRVSPLPRFRSRLSLEPVVACLLTLTC